MIGLPVSFSVAHAATARVLIEPYEFEEALANSRSSWSRSSCPLELTSSASTHTMHSSGSEMRPTSPTQSTLMSSVRSLSPKKILKLIVQPNFGAFHHEIGSRSFEVFSSNGVLRLRESARIEVVPDPARRLSVYFPRSATCPICEERVCYDSSLVERLCKRLCGFSRQRHSTCLNASRPDRLPQT